MMPEWQVGDRVRARGSGGTGVVVDVRPRPGWGPDRDWTVRVRWDRSGLTDRCASDDLRAYDGPPDERVIRLTVTLTADEARSLLGTLTEERLNGDDVAERTCAAIERLLSR